MIVVLYITVPLLGFNGEKLLSPFYIPGTVPHGLVSYFYQIVILFNLAYDTYFLNSIFIVPVIYISNQIDHQIYSIKCLSDKFDLCKFNGDHLKLLEITKKLSKILNYFGVVVTVQISLYLCAEIFFVMKVKSMLFKRAKH